MEDYRVGLFYLKELEASPGGLTTDELQSRLGQAGFNPATARTIQRDLKLFRKRKFKLGKRGRKHLFKAEGENLVPFLDFMRDFLLDEQYRSIFFGDLSVRRGVDYFSSRANVAGLFSNAIEAILQGRLLTYEYTPQTDITLSRMKTRGKFKATDSKKIPVRMLPRFLVASGSSFLLLGEFYEKQSFNKDHYAKPKQRQYELRGVANLQMGDVAKPHLNIDPQQLYQNSVQVWVGGKEHEIIVEEMFLQGKTPEKKIRKVNGEDEILSLAAASLGRLRIVNPPKELMQRADAIGLPYELIFRFEK